MSSADNSLCFTFENPRIDAHMLIICGPSGSGKSTLISHLLDARRSCELSRSTTTRSPRGLEQHGLEYDFVDVMQFKALIEEGAFAEYANVFGNFYGTPHAMIREKISRGIDVIFDIDVQGARQLKSRYPNSWCVLISPPSFEILEARLRSRATDKAEVIEKRLQMAQWELGQKDLFDFVLVNDVLAKAAGQLCELYDSLCLRSERFF